MPVTVSRVTPFGSSMPEGNEYLQSKSQIRLAHGRQSRGREKACKTYMGKGLTRSYRSS